MKSSTSEFASAAQHGTTESVWGDGIAIGPDGEVYVGGSTNGSFSGFTKAGDYDISIARLQMP